MPLRQEWHALVKEFVLTLYVLRCSYLCCCLHTMCRCLSRVVAKSNCCLAWRLMRGCCGFFNAIQSDGSALLHAGMWLSTRSQLGEFISSPFWNKTTALAADIPDSLGIAAGWGYPGTLASLNQYYWDGFKLSTLLSDTHGHGVGTFVFVVHTKVTCRM